MAQQAYFSFKGQCDNCYEVAQFVAPQAVVAGKKVYMMAECQECGAIQMLVLHYEDFIKLFCGGSDEVH